MGDGERLPGSRAARQDLSLPVDSTYAAGINVGESVIKRRMGSTSKERDAARMDHTVPRLFHDDDDARPARSHLETGALEPPSGFGILPSQRIRKLIDEQVIDALGGGIRA